MRSRQASIASLALLALVAPLARAHAQLPESPPPSVVWSAREQPLLDGEGAPGAGIPVHGRHAMAVDADGNVYVAGESSNGTDADFLTLKYDEAGQLLWWKSFDSGDKDQARGLAVTPDGGVVVMGQSVATDFDYRVVSYDKDGVERWTATYNSGVADRPYGIAADYEGAAYIAGYAKSGSNEDLTIMKFDAAGQQQWLKTMDAGGNESVEEIVIGPSGDLLLTVTSNAGSNSDFVTASYSPSGDQLWMARYDSGRSDRPYDLEIDGEGNVFVAGYSGGGNTPDDAVLVAYTPQGALRWVSTYDGGSQDHLFAVGVKPDGNLVVAGQTYNGTDYDYLTIGFTASGERSWVATYDGGVESVGTGDLGHLLTIGPDGSSYIVGDSYNSKKDYDYVTVRYDSGGNQMWVATYDGGDTDWAESVVLHEDALYVTGLSLVGESSDFRTVRYTTDGAEVWTAKEPPTKVGGDDQPGSSDPLLAKNAVALDDDDNLFVTGTSSSSAGDTYLTVSYDDQGNKRWESQFDGGLEDVAYGVATDKHEGAVVVGSSLIDAYPDPHWDGWIVRYDHKGDQDWSARYGGLLGGADYAYAVATGRDGSVYVTGRQNNGSSDDMVTMKLDRHGQKEWTATYEGGFDERGVAIAVDDDDNVYVGGISGLLVNDIVVAKYDQTGAERWIKKYDSGTDDVLADLALDGNGDVYVTGTAGSLVSDYITIRFDKSGTQSWQDRYDGGLTDTAADLAVTASGDVVVTGTSGNPLGQDLATVRYNANGTRAWIARTDTGFADKASAVAAAPGGRVFVTGSTAEAGAEPDYLTVAYNLVGNQAWSATYDNAGADTALGVAATDSLVYVSGASKATDLDFFSIVYSLAQ